MKKLIYNGFVFPIKIFLFVLKFVIFYLILKYLIGEYLEINIDLIDSLIIFIYFSIMWAVYDYFLPDQYFKLK